MSLNVMIQNATQGLLANQTALRTTSENITNAGVKDYARRETVFGSNAVNANLSIVTIDEVRRVVDEFLQKETRFTQSEAAAADRMNITLDRLQSLLGAPGDQRSFSSRIEDMLAGFSNLTLDATSSARRIETIGELRKLADVFSLMYTEILKERELVDQQIVNDVKQVNVILRELNDINQSLGSSEFNAVSDQQDALVTRLSEFIDVRATRNAQGVLTVHTANGLPLLDQSYAQITYAGESPVTEQTVFTPLAIQAYHPQTDQPISATLPLERELTSGSLRGLLDVRDTEIPAFATQIGAMASLVMDELNAVHNDNTAFPPPNTLTGRNSGLLGADAIGFSGQTTLAIVSDAGALQHRVDVNFDASTYSVNGAAPVAFSGTTLADLVADLNTALGATGSVTFANGVMTVDAANATHGVAFLDDATNPSARGGRGFSHFFGLNDLMTSSMPTHFDTGLSTTDAHGFGVGQTIDFVIRGQDGAQISRTFTMPAGNFGAAITALNNPATGLGAYFTFALNADGEMTVTPTAPSNKLELLVETDNTTRGAAQTSFTNLFGIGPAPTIAQARAVAVAPAIEAGQGRLALAKLDLSGAPAINDVILTFGDNRGALAFDQLKSKTISVPAAGRMPAMITTISQYADRVLSDFAVRARSAEDALKNASDLQLEIEARRDEVQGVNVDEELANMLTYQQSYNAAARVLTAADELLSTLLQIV